MKKATQQQTKEHNRSLVLKIISEQRNISRAEIARVTGLTRTTVSDLVSELITDRLVEEVGHGESMGGKSPILLALAENSRFLVGLDLAHDQFYGAIVNLRGMIQQTVELPVDGLTGEEALKAVFDVLDLLTASAFTPLVGIGVSTQGLVNSRDGVVITAVNLGWRNLPLARILQERYQIPVFVINDSQAAALGEYTFGEGYQQSNNLVVITARHGIGSGIILNGELYQGDGGGAGEIGHVTMVREGGLPCRCGTIGCLETVASTQAVIRQVQLLSGDPAGINRTQLSHRDAYDAVIRGYEGGDPQIIHVVMNAAHFMGLAISNLVGTLNIHRIVLSGEMTRFGQPWLDVIRETMEETTLYGLARETHVEIGTLGENGVLLGATALVLKDMSSLISR
jgi:glucokinase-like ROK family protein